MKNNKKFNNLKKFSLILLLSFVLPLYVSAADDMTYYVSNLGGNGIEGFYSYAQYWKTTEHENAEYKTSADCTAANGVFDNTDCKYWWYTYSAMCTTAAEFKSCDTRYINNPTYYRYKTVYGRFYNDTAAAEGCSSKAGYTWVTCSGTNKYVKRGTLVSRSSSKQTCQNTSFQNTATTYSGKKYSSGSFSSDCYKDFSNKICKCTTTTSETTSGYTYKNLTTAHASIKNDKGQTVTAYCISPGVSFPPSSEPYESIIEQFNLNNCGKEGANKYGCGIASIMLNAKELGYDGEYPTMITAFRLWAAAMGQEKDGNWSTELVTTNPIYKTTAQKADAGYTGTDDKTLKDQYVIHATGSGLTYLQHAIQLYNIAKSGEFETWVPYITNGSTPIPLDDSGNFEFVITTNFTEKNTTEIAVESKTDGVTLSIASKEVCGEYYCINVTGRVSGFNKQECNVSQMTYVLKYKDDRNAMGAIGLLRSKNNPNKYQKFAFFDKSKIGELVELEKPLAFECPPEYECDMPDIDYSKQTTGCHNEGTEGQIIDPTIECILGVKRLRENYDYTTLYVHDTGEGNTNDYCEVKCRETITYEMYGSTNAVSVRFIKYTNGSYSSNDLLATIVGDRQCVSEIDYDSWKEDYEDANELVRTTWNTYKYWENVHVYTKPEKEDVECKFDIPSCTDCCYCHCCDGYYASPDPETGKGGGWVCTDTCCSDGPGAYCNKEGFFLHWLPKDYAETNEDGSISIVQSAADDGEKECSGDQCAGTTGCYIRNGNYNAWAGAYSSAKYAYEQAVRSREELVSYIQDCNLYSSFNLRSAFGYTRSNDNSVYYESTEGYDFNPTYEYVYEDEYTSTISIATETKLTKSGGAKYCVGCSETSALGGTTTEILKYWNCTGTQTGAKCTDIKVTVPINTMALIEPQKKAYYWQEISYSATIPNGDIVAGESNTTLTLTDQNIFPLELDKLTGTYYANATHGNVGDEDRKEAVVFDASPLYEETYECDFEVENEITIVPDPECPTCPDPVPPTPGYEGTYGYYYRQIDVDKVFPSGVKTGTWSTVQAQNLIADIESKGEDIYLGTPDYEFIITPKNIRAIKEYNRELDAYGEGYNDFNLNCDCYTGICYCDSEFLNNLADGGLYEDLVTVYKRNGIEFRSGR